MSRHRSIPPKRRVMPAILATVAMILAIFGVAAIPAYATTSTPPEEQCVVTNEYERTVTPTHVEAQYVQHVLAVPEVKEYQFKKKVPETKTQYYFAKFTREKTKSADVWQNFSPNKDQKYFEGPPAWPSDPRGTWQHQNKPIPSGHQGPDGVYQKGTGNGSWFYRAAGVWSDYGPWTKWSPEAHVSLQDSMDPLGSPQFHGEGTYSNGTKWYRQWQDRYDSSKEPVVTVVGSHYVYFVTGQEPSLNKDDASWVTENPGDDWKQFAEQVKTPYVPAYTLYYTGEGKDPSRNAADAVWVKVEQKPGLPWTQFGDSKVVNDTPVKQGPVRSEGEPDRGDYPDVPWTKIPGTEEQTGDCGPESENEATFEVGLCVPGQNVRYVIVNVDLVRETGSSSHLVLAKNGESISDIVTVTPPNDKATFRVELASGTYRAGVIQVYGQYLETDFVIEVGEIVVPRCDDNPPTCEVENPTRTADTQSASTKGDNPSYWLSIWDANDKADQTRKPADAVNVGADCGATLPMPPPTCQSQVIQWDVSKSEPPLRIVDTNDDGVADIPDFVDGGFVTIPGDDSLCEEPPSEEEDYAEAFSQLCFITEGDEQPKTNSILLYAGNPFDGENGKTHVITATARNKETGEVVATKPITVPDGEVALDSFDDLPVGVTYEVTFTNEQGKIVNQSDVYLDVCIVEPPLTGVIEVDTSRGKTTCEGVFKQAGVIKTPYEIDPETGELTYGKPTTVWEKVWNKVRDLTASEKLERNCVTPAGSHNGGGNPPVKLPPLAQTGTEILFYMGLGVALFVMGALALVASRSRRKSDAEPSGGTGEIFPEIA